MDAQEDDPLILPDKVLNKQICSECLNYLSVGPIMTTKTNKTICGRCVKLLKNPEGLRKSFYNLVAEKCIFKCVNRLDGCEAVLTFDNVVDHEEKCSGNDHECVFCSFNGNGCQITQHYKNDHDSRLIKDNMFQLTLNSDFGEQTMVLLEENNILFVSYFQELELPMLNFTIRSLSGTVDIPRYISSIFKDNLHLVFDTKNFRISMADLQDVFPHLEKLYCRISSKVDQEDELQEKDFKIKKQSLEISMNQKRISEIEKEKLQIKADMVLYTLEKLAAEKLLKTFFPTMLKCMFCDQLVGSKIFLCSKNHLQCNKCVKSHTYCKICNCNNWSLFENIGDIELLCDWPDCTATSNIEEFLSHKEMCKFRRYRCPLKNCTFSGVKSDLVSHWHCERPALILRDCYYANSSEIKSDDSECSSDAPDARSDSKESKITIETMDNDDFYAFFKKDLYNIRYYIVDQLVKVKITEENVFSNVAQFTLEAASSMDDKLTATISDEMSRMGKEIEGSIKTETKFIRIKIVQD